MSDLSKSISLYEDQEHMSDDQLAVFKTYLSKERELLKSQIETSEIQISESAERQSDEADTASQVESMTLSMNSRNALLARLRQINASIQRIQENEYGFCASCGIEINIKRLIASPTATCCIDCQGIAEKQEQRYAQAV